MPPWIGSISKETFVPGMVSAYLTKGGGLAATFSCEPPAARQASSGTRITHSTRNAGTPWAKAGRPLYHVQRPMNTYHVLILCAALTIALLPQEDGLRRYEFAEPHMGTLVRIELYAS